MLYGSLFTGIGGFDLGFSRAGLDCAWQVEKDPDCRRVLNVNFPHTKRFTDVRGVTGRTGKGWARYGQLRAVDILAGGFPCQDLSVAGDRRGLAGARSGLWFEFHRLIVELRPRLVVIENVPGLLSSNRGADFALVLAGLSGVLPEIPKKGWRNSGFGRGLYYNVAWRILDAQYFGVPQRRRRVFIIASFGTGSAAEILFEPESVRGYPAPRREAQEEAPTVAGTLSANRGGMERPAGNANELDFCIPVADVSGTLGGGSGERGWSNDLDRSGAFIPFLTNNFGANGRNWSDKEVAYTLDGSNGNAIAFGGNNTSGPIEVATALNAHGGAGRMDFESETFLQQVSSAGNLGVRRLMPVECERLQGFPDGWTEWGMEEDGQWEHFKQQADGTRYRQLGNAVAVPVAEWLGHRIKRFLR